MTIGDYWQREFRGEEQIEDLLPALGGVIASSVGAVAGFAVGGPGGAFAGASLAGSIYGAAVSGAVIGIGIDRQDAAQTADGVVGFLFSALGAAGSFKALGVAKTAKATKTSGHPKRSSAESDTPTQNKQVDSQSASKQAQGDRPVGATKTQKQQQIQRKRQRDQPADDFDATRQRLAAQVRDEQPITSASSSDPPKNPPTQPRDAAAGGGGDDSVRRALENSRRTQKQISDRTPKLPPGNPKAVMAAQRASRGNQGLGTRRPKLPPRSETSAPPTAAARANNTAASIGDNVPTQPKSLWDRSGQPAPPPPRSLATEPPVTPSQYKSRGPRSDKDIAIGKSRHPDAQIRSFLEEIRQISGISRIQALDVTAKFAQLKRTAISPNLQENLSTPFFNRDLADSIRRLNLTDKSKASVKAVFEKNMGKSELGRLIGSRHVPKTKPGPIDSTPTLRSAAETRIGGNRSFIQNAKRSISRAQLRINELLIDASDKLPIPVVQQAMKFAKSADVNAGGSIFGRFRGPEEVLGSHLRSLHNSIANFKTQIRNLNRKIADDQLLIRSLETKIPRDQLRRLDFERLSKRIAEQNRTRRVQQELTAKYGAHPADSLPSTKLQTVQAVQKGGVELGQYADGPYLEVITAASGKFNYFSQTIDSSTSNAIGRFLDNLPGADGNVYPVLLQSDVESLTDFIEPSHRESERIDLRDYAADAITAFSGILLPWQQTDLLDSIDFVWKDLPGGQLGHGLWLPTDDGDWRFEIAVDIDADGHGWFIDSTPWEDSEFDSESGSHDSDFDLLTVLRHELGHAIGFGAIYEAFADQVEVDANDQTWYRIDDRWIALDESGNELDPTVHADQLMAATLSPGQRKDLGDIDQSIFRDIVRNHGIPDGKNLMGGAFLHSDSHLGNHGGFVLMASNEIDALNAGPPPSLANSDFAISDSAANGFQWRTIGDVSIANGIATISEDVGMISDLSQTFVVPQGVNQISFTLGGLNLDVGSGVHPPEAFEVSLLDALTTSSLFGETTGSSRWRRVAEHPSGWHDLLC